jgi:MoaA/NifB/PqqE/SkfB family radical SAM enzyme
MKELSYGDFYSRILQKSRRENRLLSAEWALTYKCNLNCKHCYLSAKERKSAKPELTLAQIKNILDQLQCLGCLNLSLTGGEVFVRKDSLDILEYLKVKGFHLSLVTNGTLITEKIAQSLSEFRSPLDFSISIYSLREDINAQIVGVRGALKKALAAVKLLRQKGIPVSIRTLVMQDNLKEFRRIKRFAFKHSMHFEYDYIVQPRLDGCLDVLKYQIPLAAIKKLREQEGDFIRITDRCTPLKSLRFSKERLFYCDAGKTSMSINPYGQAHLCLDFPFPGIDLVKEGVNAGWQKIIKFVKGMKPPKDYRCYKCQWGDFCTWCPAMGWRYEGKIGSCLSFYKKLAEMNREAFYNQA